MDVNIKVVAGPARVLADKAIGIRLVDGALKDTCLVDELATDVDIGRIGIHGTASHQTTLNKLVGVLAHDLAVLAGARLTLVGVDNQIARLGVLVPVLEDHERLEAVSPRSQLAREI